MSDVSNAVAARAEEEAYGVSGDAISDALVALSSGNVSADVFSTLDPTDPESADLTWVALSDSEPVKQNLNKPIDVTGIVILRVELLNEQTGELESQPRCVFISADGKAYHVTSPVVFRDIRTLIALKGKPSADRPVAVRFEQGGSGTRQFVTLKPARNTGK